MKENQQSLWIPLTNGQYNICSRHCLVLAMMLGVRSNTQWEFIVRSCKAKKKTQVRKFAIALIFGCQYEHFNIYSWFRGYDAEGDLRIRFLYDIEMVSSSWWDYSIHSHNWHRAASLLGHHIIFAEPSHDCNRVTDYLTVCLTVGWSSHQRRYLSSTQLTLCEKNPPVTGGFPSQGASDVGIVSILGIIMLLRFQWS